MKLDFFFSIQENKSDHYYSTLYTIYTTTVYMLCSSAVSYICPYFVERGTTISARVSYVFCQSP